MLVGAVAPAWAAGLRLRGRGRGWVGRVVVRAPRAPSDAAPRRARTYEESAVRGSPGDSQVRGPTRPEPGPGRGSDAFDLSWEYATQGRTRTAARAADRTRSTFRGNKPHKVEQNSRPVSGRVRPFFGAAFMSPSRRGPANPTHTHQRRKDEPVRTGPRTGRGRAGLPFPYPAPERPAETNGRRRPPRPVEQPPAKRDAKR
jgi:hypothetical protein